MIAINGESISILLFFVGVYGLIARRNIIKSIMSISIMQVAIILYFISANTAPGSVPPIGDVAQYPTSCRSAPPGANDYGYCHWHWGNGS